MEQGRRSGSLAHGLLPPEAVVMIAIMSLYVISR